MHYNGIYTWKKNLFELFTFVNIVFFKQKFVFSTFRRKKWAIASVFVSVFLCNNWQDDHKHFSCLDIKPFKGITAVLSTWWILVFAITVLLSKPLANKRTLKKKQIILYAKPEKLINKTFYNCSALSQINV